MTDKLKKVLDLLISEDREQADAALNEWFAEQHESIVSQLMSEDEGDAESEQAAVAEIIDGFFAETAQRYLEVTLGGDISKLQTPEGFNAASRAIAQEMATYGVKYVETDEDDAMIAMHIADSDTFEAKMQAFAKTGVVEEAEGDDEIVDADADADAEVAPAVEEEPVEDRVEDLEAQLVALKAEFDKLMGVEEVEHDTDFNGDGEIEGGDEVVDEAAGETFRVSIDVFDDGYGHPFYKDFPAASAKDAEAKAIAELDKISLDFSMEDAGWVEDENGFKSQQPEYIEDEFYEITGVENTADIVADDDDDMEDFDDLEESYNLETVKAPVLKGTKEVGTGKTLKNNTDSPIPQKKGTERVGGKGVEIKGKTHKGYERETAPKVEGGKEKFKNSQQEAKKVSKEGDKSAELNKNKEDKKSKSPIGGGAVDLRGSDMKRS